MACPTLGRIDIHASQGIARQAAPIGGAVVVEERRVQSQPNPERLVVAAPSHGPQHNTDERFEVAMRITTLMSHVN